jgi:redox-sensitive bicupin YhaK (pirin superfamily)
MCLSGALAHKDSMGNVEVILPGEVQRMSAGTGVRHSEFNHAADSTTHLLQIWIQPSVAGVTPGYEQKTFPDAVKQGRLCLIASPDGAQGSVSLHADAYVCTPGFLMPGRASSLDITGGRKAYVYLVRGALTVNGRVLTTGDAACSPTRLRSPWATPATPRCWCSI